MTPLGGWRCLDDSAASSGFDARSAIVAEGAGYAILTRQTNGASVFVRVDATGIGLP